MKPRHEFESSREYRAAVRSACVAVLKERETVKTTEIASAIGAKSISVSQILHASKLFEIAGRAPRSKHPRPEIVWRLRREEP